MNHRWFLHVYIVIYIMNNKNIYLTISITIIIIIKHTFIMDIQQ